ncbi:MAG: amidohydrolase family protein [Abditibacteriaceae bacterium]
MKIELTPRCDETVVNAKYKSWKLRCFYFFALIIMLPGSINVMSAQVSSKAQEEASLKAMAKLEPIDSHSHVVNGDPRFVAMLVRWHLHLVDIVVPDNKNQELEPFKQQRRDSFSFVNASHSHAVLCTSFDPFQFSNPNFTQSAIDGLNRDFARGAVAVKIWKNIGMQLEDSSGKYVLPDNPRFEPIYMDIAAHNKTLIAHLADPDVAWGVHTPNDIADDAHYYALHSEWRMDKAPRAPAKKTILAARDHLLEMNPQLRVVGAHLGSMESDVDLIAERFEKYPNFAIDTAARVPHLAVQPTEKVRRFILRYQDRILYGTDLQFGRQDDTAAAIKEWQAHYALDWRYFATNDRFKYHGREIQGLGLPRSVLKKIFHDNAVDWIPGVIPMSNGKNAPKDKPLSNSM